MTIVESVVDTLRAAGISASRAYPAGPMPERNEVVAAVQYYSLDQGKIQAQVLISVLAPPKVGARACEDVALQVCQVLYSAGAICQLKQTEHIRDAGMFCTSVYATFIGLETAEGWKPYEPLTEEE